MTAVVLRGVSKRFPGGVVALHPTDLALAAGDRLALVGPSGGGKTTLLRLVAGLDDPDGGDVLIGGVRANAVPPHLRGVGLVAQRPALYPQMTVAQNLALPRSRDAESSQRSAGSARAPLRGLRVAATRGTSDPVAEAVDLLRLAPLLQRYPHELSGGEQQRVALARLLVRRPAVWLLDEPLAALDPAFRSEFRADLHLLLGVVRPTMILVTHDPADAMALGHRVGVLDGGRLQHVGTPDDLRHRPASASVARRLAGSL